MNSSTDAPGQALGYMYQTLYALFLLISSGAEAQIYIEKLDDIQLKPDGDAVEALQLKHSVQKIPSNLADRSIDLWKTIGNWSEKLQTGELDDVQVLSLITVAKTSPGSIPEELEKSTEQRNSESIVARLTKIVDDVLSEKEPDKHTLYKHIQKFQKLSPSQRLLLVRQTRIFSQSPNAENIVDSIKGRLQDHPAYRDAVYEKLMGWWAERVREHLLNQSTPITREDVNIKLANIREEYRTDNLPLDFEEAEPPQEMFENQALLQFVQQLTLISLTQNPIERAIRDYYRAFSERKKWLDEKLVNWKELRRYERELIEHWEVYCHSVRNDLEMQFGSDIDNTKFGRKLYLELMKSDIPSIRPLVSAGYVQRGTYHILADEPQPRVWWHPEFVKHLREVIVTTTKQEHIHIFNDDLDHPPVNVPARPIEIANLLNPAFGAVVLYEGIKGYQEATGTHGIPYGLLYFIFPLVLTKSIRITLPRLSKSSLQAWIQKHPEHIPYIQSTFNEFEVLANEALLFGMQKHIIEKVNKTQFTITHQKKLITKKYAGEFETEVMEIRNSAQKVGKLLSHIPNEISAYLWFGVSLHDNAN